MPAMIASASCGNRGFCDVGQWHGVDDLFPDNLVQIARHRNQSQDADGRDDHHHFHHRKAVATCCHFSGLLRHR